MTKGTIFLAGGGNREQSFLFDKVFVESLKGNDILYIPVAMDKGELGYEACIDWLQQTLGNISSDFLDISLWDGDNSLPDLKKYAAVYIGGGNTYKLLHILTQWGAIDSLRLYYKDGGIIYGGSAGAIVLGETIETVAEERKNQTWSSTKGLDVVGGRSVRCHYVKELDTRLVETARHLQTDILAIPEDSGIKISQFKATVVGNGAVRYFLKDGSIIDYQSNNSFDI